MKFEVIQGECLDVMRGMVDASVDACITDPPYGLSFMGKKWDYDVPSVNIFAEIYRTLKDGSRLLCFGGTRTMHRMWVNIEDAGFTIEDSIMWIYGSGFPKHKSKLKPAYEPICVARKGHSSALNIDECRIGVDDSEPNKRRATGENGGADSVFGVGNHKRPATLTDGRWPANIILDEAAADMLDEQSGVSQSVRSMRGDHADMRGDSYNRSNGRRLKGSDSLRGFEDFGGASRFFYTAKASRSERNAGLEGMPQKRSVDDDWVSESRKDAESGGQTSPQASHHPTVKPVSLMRYLCKLITPKGGLILDPFAGSGSTGIAAQREGFQFIGIEREVEYCEIARARVREVHPLFAEAV